MTQLSKKKLFLFDIDGTLSVGETLYEGSRDLLAYIDSIGGKSYFITNNSTRNGRDYVARFQDCFRIKTSEGQFITSGYMTLRFF
jgi:ribonucleotide monophosphatase NagD (HAD superfamily)